tara:strand:+ start:1398 stop:1610 length:213 start_codon:yes stop_codon:yes gene_type:complete
MFEAMVIVCLMNNPNQCKALQDTRGPYKTLEICKERLNEMRADLLSVYNSTMMYPYSGHCGIPKNEKVAT